MSNLKVVVQLYDEKTGEYIGDADVRTTADLVFFADGQTFQQNWTMEPCGGSRGKRETKENGEYLDRWEQPDR